VARSAANTPYIRFHINISRGGANLVGNLRVIYLTFSFSPRLRDRRDGGRQRGVDAENRPYYHEYVQQSRHSLITISVVRLFDASAIKVLVRFWFLSSAERALDALFHD